jgi:hypothetical protein
MDDDEDDDDDDDGKGVVNITKDDEVDVEGDEDNK